MPRCIKRKTKDTCFDLFSEKASFKLPLNVLNDPRTPRNPCVTPSQAVKFLTARSLPKNPALIRQNKKKLEERGEKKKKKRGQRVTQTEQSCKAAAERAVLGLVLG